MQSPENASSMPPSAAQQDQQAQDTQNYLQAAQQMILNNNRQQQQQQHPSSLPLTNINDAGGGGGDSSSTKTVVRSKRPSKIDDPTPEVAQQLRFPWKLHLLLERCEYEHASDVAANGGRILRDPPIGWLPDGKSFKVHDKERFIKEVMPSFFGTQSFKTFQRNLNLWGFTRVSKGPQKDVCSHPLFLKGFPAVCRSMKRIVIKGTGRGNRAPLGGVDVSSVQAVVAAAAIQQQQQVQAQAQLQACAQAQAQLSSPQLQAGANNNSGLNLGSMNQLLMQPQVQQQRNLGAEDGNFHAALIPPEDKSAILPSQLATAASAPTSATTTVMWPSNINFNNNLCAIPQPQSIQPQQQQASVGDVNSNLQQSLHQLGSIIQQLNGSNAMATNAVNAANANSLAIAPQAPTNPLAEMSSQQQQPLQQFHQQQQIPHTISSSSLSNTAQIQNGMLNPNSIVASAPTSTQDLVTMLLQRNLQQQVQDMQPQQQQLQLQLQQAQQQQLQLQLPESTFPVPLQQQQSNLNQRYQQAISTAGNINPQNQQLLQPNPININNQQQQLMGNDQQQQQLLQLLLQQGLSTPSK